MSLYTLIIVTFVIFMAINVIIGLRGRKHASTTKDFLTASGQSGIWFIIASAVGASIGSGVVIGTTQYAVKLGVAGAWYAIACGLACVVHAFVMTRFIYRNSKADFTHSDWIHCTGRLFSLLKSGNTALIASDTRTDTFRVSSQYLVRIFRVSQCCSPHYHSVDFSIPNRCFGNVRGVHPATCKNRNVHGFFCLCCHFHKIAFRHIHGRAGIVEGIVSAGVHTQAVISVRFQQLRNLDAFLQCPSGFVLAGKRCFFKVFYKGFQTQPHTHRIIAAALLLDSF